MDAARKSEELLSLNTLARKLDISYPHALDLFAQGVLTADFTSNRIFLFRPERVAALREHIREAR